MHLEECKRLDPNFETSKDYLDTTKWSKLANSTNPLTKRQVRAIRFTALHEGIPDRFRGKIWTSLLDVESIRG